MPRPSPRRAARRPARRAWSFVVVAALLLTAGCGGPSGPLTGERLVVSSTSTTEQIVLGQLTVERLRAEGAEVVDQTNVRGSALVREALVDGDVDLAWSTTGVAWRNDLGHARPVRRPARQLALVRREDLRRNGIAWIAPARYDSGYALAVGPRAGVSTISGLVREARRRGEPVRLCVDRRFAEDREGLRAIREAYGLARADVDAVTADPAQVYASARFGGRCAAGAVLATDPKVLTDDLTLLRDDRAALTSYRPAVTLRAATLRGAPALRPALEPLAAALTGPQVRRLVARVEAGETVAQVTRAWLRDRDLA